MHQAPASVPGFVFSISAAPVDQLLIRRLDCKLGLEGIVSKRKDSRYKSGRSPDWVKSNRDLWISHIRLSDKTSRLEPERACGEASCRGGVGTMADQEDEGSQQLAASGSLTVPRASALSRSRSASLPDISWLAGDRYGLQRDRHLNVAGQVGIVEFVRVAQAFVRN
jgi:hypothetical protein